MAHCVISCDKDSGVPSCFSRGKYQRGQARGEVRWVSSHLEDAARQEMSSRTQFRTRPILVPSLLFLLVIALEPPRVQSCNCTPHGLSVSDLETHSDLQHTMPRRVPDNHLAMPMRSSATLLPNVMIWPDISHG